MITTLPSVCTTSSAHRHGGRLAFRQGVVHTPTYVDDGVHLRCKAEIQQPIGLVQYQHFYSVELERPVHTHKRTLLLLNTRHPKHKGGVNQATRDWLSCELPVSDIGPRTGCAANGPTTVQALLPGL